MLIYSAIKLIDHFYTVTEEKIRKKDLDVEMWQNLTDSACGAIELYCELMESNVGNVASNGE